MAFQPPPAIRKTILRLAGEGKSAALIVMYVGVAEGIAITEQEVKDVIKAG